MLDIEDVTRDDVVIERETSDYEAGENTAFGELLSRRLGLLFIFSCYFKIDVRPIAQQGPY